MNSFVVKDKKKQSVRTIAGYIQTDEFLLVLYFWGSALLRPFLQKTSDSGKILMLYTLVILLFSVLRLLIRAKVNINILIFLFGMAALFMIDLMFRGNAYTELLFYDFILCGIIPMYLISRVRNWDYILKLFGVFSLLLYLRYCMEPFLGYEVFQQDMSYGFELLMPAFIGMYIVSRKYGWKWMNIPLIACFMEISVFANRSSLLSVLLIMLLWNFAITKKGNIKKWILLSVFVVVLVFFFEDIVLWLSKILKSRNLSSYAVTSYLQAIQSKNVDVLMHGRLGIWKNAISLIDKHFLFGGGAGIFQSVYGIYVHNVILDIILQYGCVGLCIFIYLLVRTFHRLFLYKGSFMCAGIMFFCIWCPKLLLSVYFYNDKAFWLFLAFAFLSNRLRKDGVRDEQYKEKYSL